MKLIEPHVMAENHRTGLEGVTLLDQTVLVGREVSFTGVF